MACLAIIIPVFNAEKYLHECIQSVLKQSFTDFEVILINDGSTDSSGLICNQFAIEDNRINVIHLDNKGVSAARNVGLAQAKSEWICFIDSDDYISDNYFQPILKYKNSDFIMVNVSVDTDGDVFNFTNYPTKKLDVNSFFSNYKLYPNFAGPWSKFFKSYIIKNNNIQFDSNLSFGEDALFNLQYLSYCKIIYVTNESYYIYREHLNSLSKKQFTYQETRYLFDALQKELHKYSIKAYQQNILSPLNNILLALYNDKNLDNKFTILELENLVISNYFEIMLLYKNSVLKYLFCLSKSIRNYRFLNLIIKNKLT